jgi:hypothetical protein
MRHHEPLIAMRLGGHRPEVVQIHAGLYDPKHQWWPEWRPTHAEVYVDPADVPRHLDLRFLVGCEVWIQGYDPANEPRLHEQLRGLFDAAKRASAAKVCVLNPIGDEVLLWLNS